MAEDDTPGLLARASNGDANAVEALLQQHLPGLRAFVRLKAGAMLLERESCSDLAQSVCRDVLENAARYRPEGGAEGFRKWLFTTAMRKIADRYEHHRAQKRAGQRDEAADADQVLAAYRSFCSPSRAAIAREELGRVEAAFAGLSQEKQDVILMARVMGMPHAAIARELGKTEVAVRSILSRALAELADGLDPA